MHLLGIVRGRIYRSIHHRKIFTQGFDLWVVVVTKTSMIEKWLLRIAMRIA